MFQKSYFILFMVILFCSCEEENPGTISGTACYDYALLPETRPWEKPYLADRFVEIALGSEYNNDRPVVKKWASPMRIFIGGSPSEALSREVDRVVEEINMLVSDGFMAEVVKDSTASNLYLYFGNPANYKYRFPEVQFDFNNQDGFFLINYDASATIYSGHLFVNTTTILQETQKHLLREELTQCLGLPNDIPYVTSIFYDKTSSTTYYAQIDKEIIRLLYHPAMRPGMGEDSVRKLIKRILCLP